MKIICNRRGERTGQKASQITCNNTCVTFGSSARSRLKINTLRGVLFAKEGDSMYVTTAPLTSEYKGFKPVLDGKLARISRSTSLSKELPVGKYAIGSSKIDNGLT